MFDGFRRERKVRKTLRQLQRQRVACILHPGTFWVIELALAHDDDTEAALQTCRIRGWIDVLEHAIPNADLPSDMNPANIEWNRVLPIYKLTDAGWNSIHRTQGWVVGTFIVALVSLVVSCIAFGVSETRAHSSNGATSVVTNQK
jgi:hypothetical protein